MSKFKYRDVESSNIAAIAFKRTNPDGLGTLGVRFKSNEGFTEYRFIDVPEEMFIDLASAESIGSFFNREIRGKYESEKYATSEPTKIDESE